MFGNLREFWDKASLKEIIPKKGMIDTEKCKAKLNDSPVSIFVMLVLIWVCIAVLLSLSHKQILQLGGGQKNRKALFAVRARKAFSAIDNDATRTARDAARQKVLLHFRVDPGRSNKIKHQLSVFFDAVEQSEASAESPKQLADNDLVIRQLVLTLHRRKEISEALKKRALRDAADEEIDKLIRQGIRGAGNQLPQLRPGEVWVIHFRGMNYQLRPKESGEAAHTIADALELDPRSRDGFCAVVQQFFQAGNLDFDEAATRHKQEQAANKIEPIMRDYGIGAELVSEGEVFTADKLELLKAYSGVISTRDGFKIFVHQLGISFVVLIAAMFFLRVLSRHFFSSARDFALCALIIIASLLINYSVLQLFYFLYAAGAPLLKIHLICMVPIALGPALLSVFLNRRVAIFGGVLIVCTTALMMPGNDNMRLLFHWLVISSLIAVRMRETNNYRTFFFRLFLCNLALTVIVNIDCVFLHPARPEVSAICVCCASIFCAMAGLMLTFLFELLFNADTRMSLMVLCDFTHPLLDDLKRKANGTLYHSLNVSVLAEDGAKAIDANALQAKAGALFHDIGKLEKPAYFTENNPDSHLEYEKMSPEQSCEVIRSHVREGLVRAKKHRLPNFIRRVIATHHGDDFVSFFYPRAQEELRAGTRKEIHEEQFRYDGPPPQGREETIISLADACEAACRSINDPTPQKIEEMVDKIFVGRLRGGQLRLSMLTLEELLIVKKCFIDDLGKLVHRRISYPQEKKDDPTSLRVEAPAPAGSPEK